MIMIYEYIYIYDIYPWLFPWDKFEASLVFSATYNPWVVRHQVHLLLKQVPTNSLDMIDSSLMKIPISPYNPYKSLWIRINSY